MSDAPRTDEVRRLLLAHADRSLTGPVEDPAVMAAVVGVERLVVLAGTTDAERLRALIHGGGRDGAGQEAVRALLAETERHVVTALDRRATGQSVDAGVVNPEAGAHAVMTDATLLRAAVRASQRSYDAMPYYRARYGERGARFANSDSAWLVSLPLLGEDKAMGQVAWLTKLLANRGMPSWLMELHLGALVAEMREVAGDEAVGALPAVAESLAGTRRRTVDDDLLGQAESWAATTFGDALPVARTGALVAAAVADVRSGLTRDDSVLLDWLTDPQRTDAAVADGIRGLRDRVLAAAGG